MKTKILYSFICVKYILLFLGIYIFGMSNVYAKVFQTTERISIGNGYVYAEAHGYEESCLSNDRGDVCYFMYVNVHNVSDSTIKCKTNLKGIETSLSLLGTSSSKSSANEIKARTAPAVIVYTDYVDHKALYVSCYDSSTSGGSTPPPTNTTTTSSNGIELQCPCVPSFGSDTITLKAAKIKNTSSSRSTGTLKLQLWVTTTPYSGGGLSGYIIGEYQINQSLPPNTSFTNVSRAVSQIVPPPGEYYFTMTLSEYQSGFKIVDYTSFNGTSVVGGTTSSGGTSGSDDSNNGGTAGGAAPGPVVEGDTSPVGVGDNTGIETYNDDSHEEDDSLLSVSGKNALMPTSFFEGLNITRSTQFDADWHRIVSNSIYGNGFIALYDFYTDDKNKIKLELFDKFGNLLAAGQDYPFGWFIDYDFGGAVDSYYLKISGTNAGEEYGLAWTSNSIDGTDDSREPNDSSSFASVLRSTSSSSIRNSGRVKATYNNNTDWYSIDLKDKEELFLQIAGSDMEIYNSKGEFVLDIVNDAYRKVTIVADGGADGNVHLTLKVTNEKRADYELLWSVAQPSPVASDNSVADGGSGGGSLSILGLLALIIGIPIARFRLRSSQYGD